MAKPALDNAVSTLGLSSGKTLVERGKLSPIMREKLAALCNLSSQLAGTAMSFAYHFPAVAIPAVLGFTGISWGTQLGLAYRTLEKPWQTIKSAPGKALRAFLNSPVALRNLLFRLGGAPKGETARVEELAPYVYRSTQAPLKVTEEERNQLASFVTEVGIHQNACPALSKIGK